MIQEIPKEQSPEEISEINRERDHQGFRDLQIFKEFLKVFPFAAKIEEERLAAIGPVEIDFDVEEPFEVDIVSPKVNEMDVKLPVQIPEATQVTFSSLMANSSSSTEAVTPLTEYIKSLALDKKLPAAKQSKHEKYPISTKSKKKKEEKKNYENKNGHDEKKKSRRDKQREKQAEKIKENPAELSKKKFKSKSSTENSNNGSLVDKPQNVPVIKGVPKILGRKQENSEAMKPSEQPIETPASKHLSDNNIFIKEGFDRAPTKKDKPTKVKTLAERSRPTREPYISPDDSQSIELVRSVINTGSTGDKATDKASESKPVVLKQKTSDQAKSTAPLDKAEKLPQKISIKTKQTKKETPMQDIQSTAKAVKEEPKKQVLIAKKQAEAQVKESQTPKKPTQPKEPKQPNESNVSKEIKPENLDTPVPLNVVKKIFKTSAKTQTSVNE